MQLDLLYKGLPSAKADTRKFRVQIHSDAISFTQREGGGGRKGPFIHVPPPAALGPRPTSQRHLPARRRRGWKKEGNERGKGKGCGRAGASPEQPGDRDAPAPAAPGPPRRVPKPPAPACPSCPQRSQDKPGRSARLGRRVNKAKPLWFIAGSAAAFPSPPLPPVLPVLPAPHPFQHWLLTPSGSTHARYSGKKSLGKKKNMEN